MGLNDNQIKMNLYNFNVQLHLEWLFLIFEVLIVIQVQSGD